MNLERDAPNIDRTDQKRVSAFCEIERVALPGIVMNVEHLFVEEHDHPKATFPFHDSRERTSNLTCGYRLSHIQSLVNICKHHPIQRFSCCLHSPWSDRPSKAIDPSFFPPLLRGASSEDLQPPAPTRRRFGSKRQG